MRLTYRNGFIDVDEVGDDAALGAGRGDGRRGSGSRVRSVPERRSFTRGEPELDAREKDLESYVDGLLDRLEDPEEPFALPQATQAPVQPAKAQEAALPLGSLGSRGHPEVCARPCIHFISGSCEKGEACGFCHIDHEKKNVKLDKKQRSLVKALGSQALAQLMLPLCRERLTNAKLSSQGAEVLQILAEFATTPGTPAEAISDHDLKYLRRTMARMNLSCLVSIFQHQHGERSGRLMAAMDHLRTAVGLSMAGPEG